MEDSPPLRNPKDIADHPESGFYMERRRILIVDDDVELVDFLKGRLEYQGYEVVVAYDGESGLRAVRAFCPHVVFDLIG